MTGESEPRRQDEASSTHARTIAKALSVPDGSAGFCGGCQKTVTKRYRSKASRSRQTVPLQRIQGIRDSRIRLDDFSTFGVEPVYTGSPSAGRAAAEEVLDLGEEAGGLGLGGTGGQLLELGQQLLLLLGEVLRRFDRDLNIHVAGLAGAQHRHALGRDAEAPAGLGSGGHLHFGLALVDGRHLELAAQSRRHHRDRHAAMQVGAVALEELVGRQRKENVEITRRTAADAGFAFAREPDPGAVLDALRDVDRQGAVALHAARARAGRACVLDHLAAAMTAGAGALQREEALGLADASGAAAGRAGLRLGAGLGAGARAGVAGDRDRNLDLRRLALERFFQRDFHVVAEIGAAFAAATAATLAGHAEQIFEDVGEGGGEAGAEAGMATHAAALLEGGVAEAVIGGALVAVLEDLIGLVDFLEPDLALGIAGIFVRMPLH